MSDDIQVEGEGEELPHLLLVDDDATFTRVMARAMARRGFRVSTAGSAEEGLTIAQADLPDYAALDLKMDGDSGLVLLPKLLELDPEMRVVILTGYSSIATAVEAIKRGACNYLCKPADADDVLAALLSEHADLDTLVPENPMSVDRLQWEHIQRVLTEHEGKSPPLPAPWACTGVLCSANCRSALSVAEPVLNNCCHTALQHEPIIYDRFV